MQTKTKFKLILIFLVLVAVLVFDFILYSFVSKKYNQIIQDKKDIVVESTQSKSLTDLKNKITELEKIEKNVNDLLIDKSKIVDFISVIEELSNNTETQVLISGVDFKEAEKENEFGLLNMKFKVSGDWLQVMNFLTTLENLPHLITIDSLRLNSGQGESGIFWSTDFSLTILTN